MGDKIVIENYPIERLPDDLRPKADVAVTARVTVEPNAKPVRPVRPLHELMGSARGVYATPEEAVAAIRALRDEWDD